MQTISPQNLFACRRKFAGQHWTENITHGSNWRHLMGVGRKERTHKDSASRNQENKSPCSLAIRPSAPIVLCASVTRQPAANVFCSEQVLCTQTTEARCSADVIKGTNPGSRRVPRGTRAPSKAQSRGMLKSGSPYFSLPMALNAQQTCGMLWCRIQAKIPDCWFYRLLTLLAVVCRAVLTAKKNLSFMPGPDTPNAHTALHNGEGSCTLHTAKCHIIQ